MINLLDPLCDNAADWAALNNDTTNLANSGNYGAVCGGTYPLEFDKANGTANTKYALIYRTGDYTAERKANIINLTDRLNWLVYVSATTNVAAAVVRLGRDASNYIEYRFADSSITAAKWQLCSVQLGDGYEVGTGVDLRRFYWLGVGVYFDAETDVLADIGVNWLSINEACPV